MIKLSRDAKGPAYGQGLSWYYKVGPMAESGGQKSIPLRQDKLCLAAKMGVAGAAANLLLVRLRRGLNYSYFNAFTGLIQDVL